MPRSKNGENKYKDTINNTLGAIQKMKVVVKNE